MSAHKTTICLSMIVKNEAQVIRRCLDSVRPIISHWVIVDTGSTDGTQQIIRDHLKDIPGSLHERPWKDFAHNRSEALSLSRPCAQYSLIIDADDLLELPADFKLDALNADGYALEIRDPPLLYHRTQLVNNRLTWFYRGVLHEFVTSQEPHRIENLAIGMRRHHDGARRKDSSWFSRDIEVLERALQSETDPSMRARYTFYLAQSYRDSKNPQKAVEHYLRRARQGHWSEEVYVSLYQAGRLMHSLDAPDDDVLALYREASAISPERIEALHAASRLCRIRKRYKEGYDFAKRGLGKTGASYALFVEQWIYDTGLLDEFAVNAYWTGRYDECLDACLKLLKTGKLSEQDQPRVIDNAKWAWSKLSSALPVTTLGEAGRKAFTDQFRVQPPRQLRSRADHAPRVLLAILAKQKENSLPLYLKCIEELDYPKSAIVLYVRTNNNRDRTEPLLRDWLARVGHLYAAVEFDHHDVDMPVQNFGIHEWNATRFKVIGDIRQESLAKTLQYDCAYYFVADVDNFIRPNTLAEMVALDLPIVAPFLRCLNSSAYYSNFHSDVDNNGYYVDCAQYYWIANRWISGVFEVPVVHCTYLVRADVIPELRYTDLTQRFEYVIFSDSARRAAIPQYIDNRQVYGYISFEEGGIYHVKDGFKLAEQLMGAPSRQA